LSHSARHHTTVGSYYRRMSDRNDAEKVFRQLDDATEALRRRANAFRRGLFFFWATLSVLGLLITFYTFVWPGSRFKVGIVIFPIIPAIWSGLRWRGGGTARKQDKET